MITVDKNLQVPIVVTTAKSGKCDIFIPDFQITVHGFDYVDAQANAILKASAIYYYNMERNIQCELKETYASSQAYCTKRNSFVTFMQLTT